MTRLKGQIAEATEWLKSRMPFSRPDIALVLGSGLGDFANGLEESSVFPAKDIPHWPESTVSGHKGRLVFGRLEDKNLLIQQGRVHFYEGYDMQTVVFPVRVFAKLGVRSLILTNATGALNPGFRPGDLMLIEDHINLMGTNPLIGPNFDSLGPRFPDMSDPYFKQYRQIAEEVAGDQGIRLQKGLLAAVTGPSYETAAEVNMLRQVGGDAVCMSTVPEVIAAVHCGLKVLGISCITNQATGLSEVPLSHTEVAETAARVQDSFVRLIRHFIKRLPIKID